MKSVIMATFTDEMKKAILDEINCNHIKYSVDELEKKITELHFLYSTLSSTNQNMNYIKDIIPSLSEYDHYNAIGENAYADCCNITRWLSPIINEIQLDLDKYTKMLDVKTRQEKILKYIDSV